MHSDFCPGLRALHIFLQGPRNIGKSAAILKTLDILGEQPRDIAIAGFYTWNSRDGGTQIFMRPAAQGREGEIYRLASYNNDRGGLECDFSVFEKAGVNILTESAGADIIVMDELGFLEAGAPAFRKAALDILDGNVPVLGVLRQGKEIPWHDEIKNHPRVSLYDVNEKNRDDLPRELAENLLKRWQSG
jgi:nucleoside-triphosphatase